MKCEEITDKVIKIFYEVYNKLGYGFLEKVYENAMMIEFDKKGINYCNQFPIKVYYDNFVVGDYVADFIVENKIIVELKSIWELSSNDERQLLNYLKSTDKKVGLLLNYGDKPRVRRKSV